MSCSLRDAVELEARGIPTVVIANDVFEPIAHATAAMLGLPGDYVARNVIFLPHPTSMLAREAVRALIDARIGDIEDALLGRRTRAGVEAANAGADPLEAARAALADLRTSVQRDGADIVAEAFHDGVLDVRVTLDANADCSEGTCLVPPKTLEAMIAALVSKNVPSLARVRLDDPRLEENPA